MSLEVTPQGRRKLRLGGGQDGLCGGVTGKVGRSGLNEISQATLGSVGLASVRDSEDLVGLV